MLCEDAQITLAALFDLDGENAHTIDLRAHLIGCGECRQIYAGLLLLRAVARVARTTWGQPYSQATLFIGRGIE